MVRPEPQAEVAKVIIRQANASDKNVIMSSWLKGQHYGNAYYTAIPAHIFYEVYAETIKGILARPGVQITIACDEGNPEWVVGYAVFKAPDLYWVYVKKDYRGEGIARLLLKGHRITTVKAITKPGLAIARLKGLTFNPF